MNCEIHPLREGVLTIGGKSYCATCQADMAAASSRVSRHVEPKNCFVWYSGTAQGWQPIPGTGCAHWVMHQLNRKVAGTVGCLEGYPLRVSAVTIGRSRVDVANVQVNDIYVTPAADHTGLVVRVEPHRITIRHDSSGQGRVAENDFASYFHRRGSFYR